MSRHVTSHLLLCHAKTKRKRKLQVISADCETKLTAHDPPWLIHSPGCIDIYIRYQWQGLLFKTSPASFSALDICDEAAGVREKISLILLPSVKMETRQKEKRAVGHSSFYHLSNTHAWLKGLCKLGGLHHLYQTPSKMKRQAAATVNIDKALT